MTLPNEIKSVEDVVREFRDKFPDLREYYPAYWSKPDKDGTQRAIPSDIKDMTAVVEDYISTSITALLKHAQGEIEKEMQTDENRFDGDVSADKARKQAIAILQAIIDGV